MPDKNDPGLASGVYAALLTPSRPNTTEADAGRMLEYLDSVTRAKVDGLVLFGSTGEFIHYELSERMRVVGLAVRRSRVPILVNVSHSSLAGAFCLAEHALNAGAAGILLMPPYFYHFGEDQIFHFYKEFAESFAGSVPIYLYNLPFFTEPISPGLATRLLESGVYAGIKDSSGDWNFFEHLRQLRIGVPFRLLAGNESLYLRARSAGADGIVSGVSAAIPELVVAIERSIEQRDLERAEELNAHLDAFVSWLRRFPATMAIKQAAASRGWIDRDFAVPPDPGTQDHLHEFQAWFERWLPRVIADCSIRATVKSVG